MDRSEAEGRAGTEQPSRALAVIGTAKPLPRAIPGGRPMAPFLAQLMLSVEPGLRPARSQRTREAAALYAQAARCPAGRRV